MVDGVNYVLLNFGATDCRLLVIGHAVLDHGIGICHVDVDKVVLPRCQSVCLTREVVWSHTV